MRGGPSTYDCLFDGDRSIKCLRRRPSSNFGMPQNINSHVIAEMIIKMNEKGDAISVSGKQIRLTYAKKLFKIKLKKRKEKILYEFNCKIKQK